MTVPKRDESFEEFFDSTFPLAQHVAYRVVGDTHTAEDLRSVTGRPPSR